MLRPRTRNEIQTRQQGVPHVLQQFTPFKGGINLEEPPLLLPPGVLRQSQNFVCDVLGGYRTILGYERFDGTAAPSAAQYSVMNFTLSGAIVVGNTITGGTSGATGVVIAIVFGATNYVVITQVTGTFVTSEALKVGGVSQGTSTSAATIDGAPTAQLHAQYLALAADQYRTGIAKPTGSGGVIGVVRLSGVTYAVRNNAGATAAVFYRSSGSSWQQVLTGSEVSFTVGDVVLNEGATLTQGGVTATIKRVVATSGALSTHNLAGRLIIYNIAGGNFAAGAATTTGGGTLTLSGAQTLIAIQPSGAYEFIIENFGGAAGTRRIYGVDGANPAFEFDGSDYSYTPIRTGMVNDMPTHIVSHINYLFLSFQGGSVQHSGAGTPYIWSAVLGAAEIAVGDNITGFLQQPGVQGQGTLAIFTLSRVYMLYGTGPSTWQMVPYRKEIGAFPGSMQQLAASVFLDHKGLVDFKTTLYFGNFVHETFTERIKTWLNTERTKVKCSCISRDRNEYRIFFSDQYALYVTFAEGKVVGMAQQFFADVVQCVWSSEEADGSETIFFGTSSGYVMQMERGTSFDGANIQTYMALAYDFLKSPRTLKHYLHTMLEITGQGYADFQFSYSLGYGDSTINQPGFVADSISFTSEVWDVGGVTWDAGNWDGLTLFKKPEPIGGAAENISLILQTNTNYNSSFRISGALTHYEVRRRIRA